MGRWERGLPCTWALWPGLSQLWQLGSLRGLAKALVFGVLLQITILTTFIWTESIGLTSRCVVWFFVLAFWSVYAAPDWFRAVRAWRDQFRREDFAPLFRDAQREYLKGEWCRAESILRRILQVDSGDAEARLLLATVYRRWERATSAEEVLDGLAQTIAGERWSEEIREERQRIGQIAAEQRISRLDTSLHDVDDTGLSLDSASEAA